MPHPEQQFRWTWRLQASPEALWPLVSNTDRFNRDCGYPPVQIVPRPPSNDPNAPVTSARRLRTQVLGLPIEWDELAFEWIAPERFAVERTYHRGPVARLVVVCSLQPEPGGGTQLIYEMRVTPSGLAGRFALPFTLGRRAYATIDRVLRTYDAYALRGMRVSALARPPRLAPGGAERLATIAQDLIHVRSQPAKLVEKLRDFVATADDLSLARIRPYAVADEWRSDRRETLHVFLHATRAGLLDFSWDLVCPHCRGAKPGAHSLEGLRSEEHCDSCNIDFTVNFDHSVELTFTPNASVRAVVRADYCIGGPQVTPHILAQQRLEAGARRTLRLAVESGRYRVRASGLPGQNVFRADPAGQPVLALALGEPMPAEPALAPSGEITIVNGTPEPRLAVLERLAWTDQATTAAEVTSLQLFRDLFSREVLRPGEQISVGAMTVVFTDLKNSTQLYRQIGDAPAFGRVLTHFEILKAAVAAEGGCIVKTMGDAIMAVFPRPIAAVRAMIEAQRWLAAPTAKSLPGATAPLSSLQPLALKAGIHLGPCLAINQNERLDYFGTTVNTTARLCGLCTGADIVLSAVVCADPEVAAFLRNSDAPPSRPEHVQLKGFGELKHEIVRLVSTDDSAPAHSPRP